MKPKSFLLALVMLVVCAPAWASSPDGLATVLVVYAGSIVVVPLFMFTIVLCSFRVFRNLIAFVVYSLLVCVGSIFILYIAFVDSHGKPPPLAILVIFLPFTASFGPALVQQLIHLRQKQQERRGDSATLAEIIARGKP